MMQSEEGDDRYHVTSASLAGAGKKVLKSGDSFAVLSRRGDITRAHEEGLYHRGARFLSRLRLWIAGQPPLLLSSNIHESNLQLNVDLTNADVFGENGSLAIPYGTLHLARSYLLRPGFYLEQLAISNYGMKRVQTEIQFDFEADFVDVFEVRGTQRETRGRMLDATATEDSVTLRYEGLDDVTRRTRLGFSERPARLSADSCVHRLDIPSGGACTLYLWAECLEGEATSSAESVSFESALGETRARSERLTESECQIHTSNEQFNDWLGRSRTDLQLLLTETSHGLFPYAGIPWFSAPFGRDALWTALECLWFAPDVARGVLTFLSHHQAIESDDYCDAEPGKILHEMRDGEMASLREIPFARYYGSIDSTPLYLMLAEQYFEVTGDRVLIESIWPNLLRAVDWIFQFGDRDGDGFVEYGTRNSEGLANQGWKDSHDAVFHRDGDLAETPIALCEVQGYVYAALRGMSRLAQVLGERGVAKRCQSAAEALRERFDQAFWSDEIGTFALALDGRKRPCLVKSSNAGQCLYTGIVKSQRVPALTQSLMSPELFSGWGIRTIASDERRFNPMSYHRGSIWPHDTAVIAAGLARHGAKAEAAQLLAALFDASLSMDLHRMPELFCGFPRRFGQAPTQYPVACSPQAWAAGAVFLLVGAVLGLEVYAADNRVVLRNTYLPPFLKEVSIQRLRVGRASVDLTLRRHASDVGMTVDRKQGDVEVVAVR